MTLRSVIAFFILISLNLSVAAEYIAFDMDETLIQSDKLLNVDVKHAKELGFDVKKSLKGIDYIIRPGATEILDYSKNQGFDLIVISHNVRPYLEDILLSSGLDKYFDRVIAHEDLIKPVNTDYKTYPQHRNKTYPQWSLFEAYKNSFINGFIVRGWLNFTGNKNIHPYLPSTNNAKYPPMYDARVLIDNASYNVDDPVDFVGIKVSEFFAREAEELSDEWIEELKSNIDLLKAEGWVELYKSKYHKDPIVEEVSICH
jgi:hypothetical protein